MWTPKAFHVSEIPANNIIHVTDSLAVRQTRQNTSLFFQHTSQSNFVTDFVSRSRKSNQSTRGQSAEYLHASMCVYIANIFRGRIEYELIYSLRGAKHRVDYSVHIR